MELLLELALQLVIELLFELGFHGVKEIGETRPKRNPFLAAVGFLLLGGVVGGITLLIIPHSILRNDYLRVANLVVTPLAVAAIISGIGRFRNIRGHRVIAIDSFGFAYSFALAMALTRYFFA